MESPSSMLKSVDPDAYLLRIQQGLSRKRQKLSSSAIKTSTSYRPLIVKPANIEEGEQFNARTLKRQGCDLLPTLLSEDGTRKFRKKDENSPNSNARIEDIVKTIQKSMRVLMDIAPSRELCEKYAKSSTRKDSNSISIASVLKHQYSKGSIDIFNSIMNYNNSIFSVPSHTFTFAESGDEDKKKILSSLDAPETSKLLYDNKNLPALPQIKNSKTFSIVFMHQTTLTANKTYLTDYEVYVSHSKFLRSVGQAVLNSLMGKIAFKEFPSCSDVELAKLKAELLNPTLLSKWALDYGFDKHIVNLPKNTLNDSQKIEIYSDIFLSYIGGLAGEDGCDFDVITRLFETLSDPFLRRYEKSPNFGKGFQKAGKREIITLLTDYVSTPEFRFLNFGDNVNSPFISECVIEGKVIGTGVSMFMKEAEAVCASIALQSEYVTTLQSRIKSGKAKRLRNSTLEAREAMDMALNPLSLQLNMDGRIPGSSIQPPAGYFPGNGIANTPNMIQEAYKPSIEVPTPIEQKYSPVAIPNSIANNTSSAEDMMQAFPNYLVRLNQMKSEAAVQAPTQRYGQANSLYQQSPLYTDTNSPTKTPEALHSQITPHPRQIPQAQQPQPPILQYIPPQQYPQQPQYSNITQPQHPPPAQRLQPQPIYGSTIQPSPHLSPHIAQSIQQPHPHYTNLQHLQQTAQQVSHSPQSLYQSPNIMIQPQPPTPQYIVPQPPIHPQSQMNNYNNETALVVQREGGQVLPIYVSHPVGEIDLSSKDRLYSLVFKAINGKPEYTAEKVVDGYKTFLYVNNILAVIATETNKQKASQRCAMTLLENDEALAQLGIRR